MSANGQEVSDAQTGLTWRRCAVGMAWNGSSCTGNYSKFTHEAALAFARDQAGWRLPNVKELQTVVDKTRANPSIEPNAFPDTPSDTWFWTSTPLAADPSNAWAVYFYNGLVGADYRGSNGAVRLVRASQ